MASPEVWSCSQYWESNSRAQPFLWKVLAHSFNAFCETALKTWTGTGFNSNLPLNSHRGRKHLQYCWGEITRSYRKIYFLKIHFSWIRTGTRSGDKKCGTRTRVQGNSSWKLNSLHFWHPIKTLQSTVRSVCLKNLSNKQAGVVLQNSNHDTTAVQGWQTNH